MKKLSLLLMLMLLLAACSNETTASSTDESTAGATAVTAETPAEEAESVDDTEETADSDDDHEHGDDTHTHANEVDISLFYDGALAEDVTMVDCTLSDGTETTCYEITIAGYPADYDAGPFCPETTAATAEEGGIWLDGDAVYDIDGEFILNLAELYNDDNWQLYDDDGNVNITDTQEEFELAAQPNVDPSAIQPLCRGAHRVAGQW